MDGDLIFNEHVCIKNLNNHRFSQKQISIITI